MKKDTHKRDNRQLIADLRARVPGITVSAIARRLQITRQCVYNNLLDREIKGRAERDRLQRVEAAARAYVDDLSTPSYLALREALESKSSADASGRSTD